PNTGGMGAYAPMPEVGPGEVDHIMEAAVLPLIAELRRRGIEYRGVLYAGLMLTSAGPQVIEYNVRFGDPEAQVVLPLLDVDAAAPTIAEARAGAYAAAEPIEWEGMQRRRDIAARAAAAEGDEPAQSAATPREAAR